MNDLINRAEQATEWARRYGQHAQTIRDLIAALQAAPTPAQLREWADWQDHYGHVALAAQMRAAATRMEGE